MKHCRGSWNLWETIASKMNSKEVLIAINRLLTIPDLQKLRKRDSKNSPFVYCRRAGCRTMPLKYWSALLNFLKKSGAASFKERRLGQRLRWAKQKKQYVCCLIAFLGINAEETTIKQALCLLSTEYQQRRLLFLSKLSGSDPHQAAWVALVSSILNKKNRIFESEIADLVDLILRIVSS